MSRAGSSRPVRDHSRFYFTALRQRGCGAVRTMWGLNMERDFWFYRRRASEEAWAAKRAITASARERHEALAQSFRERLEQLEEGELLSRA